jgi:enediyne biosynthesis protein E4
MLTVSTASGYLSSSDKRAHFGLGEETVVEAIDVRWPSGILQHLTNIKADQLLRIDEPAASSSVPPSPVPIPFPRVEH